MQRFSGKIALIAICVMLAHAQPLCAQEAQQLGELRIQSEPSGMQVEIDGRVVGNTEYVTHLPYGPHQIRVFARFYQPIIDTVVVSETSITRIYRMVPRRIPITLINAPPQAAIYIDGERIGTSGDSLLAPAGFRKLKIRSSGYSSYSQRVVLAPNAENVFSIALNRKTKYGAMWRSMLIPGWGQKYQEKGVRQFAYPVLFCGAAVLSYVSVGKYNDSVEDYRSKRNTYLAAYTSMDIEFGRQQMLQAYDQLEADETTRNLLFALTGAIWLWNIADTILTPPGYDSPQIRPQLGIGRMMLGVGFSF